jgi:hypothetical protein
MRTVVSDGLNVGSIFFSKMFVFQVVFRVRQKRRIEGLKWRLGYKRPVKHFDLYMASTSTPSREAKYLPLNPQLPPFKIPIILLGDIPATLVSRSHHEFGLLPLHGRLVTLAYDSTCQVNMSKDVRFL